MRVIRTEFLFDQYDVDWPPGIEHRAHPSVSFAWFKLGHDDEVVLPNFHSTKRIPLERIENEVVTFLNEIILRPLTQGPGSLEPRAPITLSNQILINDLLDEAIVVERSPISDTTIRTLLSKATGASIGTYVGVNIADGCSFLLLITVPLGIILVGTSIGVSKGLEAGLHKVTLPPETPSI